MTIAKDFASKAAVAFVAVAMIFSMIAPAAQAQSTEDLQTMINTLLAQIATLQGQVEGSTGAGSTSSASFCPYTWTRDLATGATGADVMKLQQFLNSDADTRVAATGAGSMGMETETFGPATAAAVSKFQVKYRAEVLSPNGLVNPTGYFGASSRNKANSLCATAVTPTTPGEEGEEEEGEEEETGELQGEGSLDRFEIDDAPDTDISEGASDEVIAELTMEATDGDIEITRMDIVVDRTTSGGEQDPWETFETITLWMDGEMIAEFDASDEDEYLDEDDGSMRFTGLEIVLMEDEEVEVLVGASVQSDVDGVTDVDAAEWEVYVTEVRYFDADGVAEDDDSTEDINTTNSAAVDFDIVPEGDGEELNFSLASSNPDATDIVVDTDSTTDGVTILEYTIEAEEADIELNTLFASILTSTTSSLVIDDVTMEVDGESFDAENSASTTSNTTIFEFDIDGDVVVDAGTEVTVKVMVDFRAQESSNNIDRYMNGTTIKATAEVDLTEAEGADDIATGDLTGSAVGESHTLVAEGIVVPVDGVETATDTQGDNDQTGVLTIDFEVSAVEGDFYITDNVLGTSTASNGVVYLLEGPAGFVATSSGVLSSTADEDNDGVYTVREGETETFTLTVTVDTNTTGQHRISLTEVNYSDDEDGITGAELYTPTPAQDFRTSYININAN